MIQIPKNKLGMLPSSPRRRPSPLEIVAPKPSRHVDNFTDKVETRDIFCLHRLGIERRGIHGTDRYLSLLVTPGTTGVI